MYRPTVRRIREGLCDIVGRRGWPKREKLRENADPLYGGQGRRGRGDRSENALRAVSRHSVTRGGVFGETKFAAYLTSRIVYRMATVKCDLKGRRSSYLIADIEQTVRIGRDISRDDEVCIYY